MFAILQNLNLPQARNRQAIAVIGLDLQPLKRNDLPRRDLLRPRNPTIRALLDIVQLLIVFDAPRLAEAPALEAQELGAACARVLGLGRDFPAFGRPCAVFIPIFGVTSFSPCFILSCLAGGGCLFLLFEALLQLLLFLESCFTRDIFSAVCPASGHGFGGDAGSRGFG